MPIDPLLGTCDRRAICRPSDPIFMTIQLLAVIATASSSVLPLGYAVPAKSYENGIGKGGYNIVLHRRASGETQHKMMVQAKAEPRTADALAHCYDGQHMEDL